MTQTKEFPYEKTVLLNAVYDVLERMDFTLNDSDSKTGDLIFADGGRERFAARAVGNKGSTQLSIAGEGELPAVFLDEIASSLHHHFEKK